jgi:hydroxymethylglutaryl-CoA lyase
MIKLIECPRDAMQGLETFIPTGQKVNYLNQLLRVGFDTLDFGSFVSPKAIPQMRDTREVFEKLDRSSTKTKLLAIVANTRGGEEACSLAGIDYLGFPMSISETFQMRNTNKSISEALNTVNELKDLTDKSGKELVVYLSMGFGNPYSDPFSPEIVLSFAGVMKSIGINIISLADTIGASTPELIAQLFTSVQRELPDVELGVHLHSSSMRAFEKIKAAYDAGCRRYDGALLGFGGCPMADDELVGNLDTTALLNFLHDKGHQGLVNQQELSKALLMANKLFLPQRH